MSLSDEDYAQLAQEIPSPNEPFLRHFFAGSTRLQDQESALRADTGFRNSLSPLARRAATIVAKIRTRENETVWTGSQGSEMTVHAGMPFALAKPLLETTNLWRIMRRMPKGGVLHAHLNGMVDFDWLLDLLMKTPGMHISAEAALDSSEALTDVTVNLGYRKVETSETSIWTSKYVPGTWRQLEKAASEFTKGGRDGFLKWLKAQCTISKNEAVEQHHGPDAIWKSFGRCFEFADSIISYEPIFRAFLRHLMSSLHADNVNWIELRVTLGLNYYRKGRETPETNYDHVYHAIDEELARFKSDPSHASFWGLRLIWTSNRALPTRALIQDMDNCLSTKLTYPSLIAGYDVCGREDAGRSLKDLLPELFWFKKQCAQERVEVPFFFHAGETLAAGAGTADENLYDAILLGTRRLGHALGLYRHPLLVDLVKEKRILVESCPVSSEVLRLTGPVRTNPLPALIARGVPCSLGSDCPAVLGGAGAAGASHDYWQALQGWGGLGLEGLGALAENGVRWAAFEDEDAKAWGAGVREASLGGRVKAQRLKQWATAWEEFCLWIVTEYGEELGDEEGGVGGEGLEVKAAEDTGEKETNDH
ncbi:hypothetical protein ACHAQH_001341 [Verticillium albo-atrum]